MDDRKLQHLRAAAKVQGDMLGVSAELQVQDVEGSAFDPAGKVILLRVFRLMPGQRPEEYSRGLSYALDTPDVQGRIERDIETAAHQLYAVP